MGVRLRLLFMALLVGSAVLLMHVELSASSAASASVDMAGTHALDQTTHAAHEHGSGGGQAHHDRSHDVHLLSACSMVLVALAGVGLRCAFVRSQARFTPRSISMVRGARQRAVPVRRRTPARPPDLAVLSVMRC